MLLKAYFAKEELGPRLRELRLSMYLLTRNRLTRAALLVVLLLVLLALLAPWVVPYPSHIVRENNPVEKLLAPSWRHPCGTDELGRDLFSRIVYGTRISLLAGLVIVGFSVLIGTLLGAVAGTLGGLVDEVIMRVTDIFLSLPPLLLAIAIAAILGPSLLNAEIATIIAWWPWYTRLVRGQAISLKERQFVKAAWAIGTPVGTVVLRHIIPNSISPVIIQASMDMGTVILTLASLSFLGLGAQAPIPEWGLLVNTSKNYFMNAWWYTIFPGFAIFLTVIAFNLLGDGMREILDPKTRKL